jgi:hypothetical protein
LEDIAMSPRPPIVVWCNHGIEGARGEPAQRYRWDDSQGKWIPSDNTTEGNAFVPTVDPQSSKSETLSEGEALLSKIVNRRQHYNATCKRCPRLVAMRERGAQLALTRIWELGESGKLDLKNLSLNTLQRAYDTIPKVLR